MVISWSRMLLGRPLQNVVGIVIAPCYGVPARDFAAIQARSAIRRMGWNDGNDGTEREHMEPMFKNSKQRSFRTASCFNCKFLSCFVAR